MPDVLEALLILLALIIGLATLVRLGHGTDKDAIPADIHAQADHPQIYQQTLLLVPISLLLAMLIMGAITNALTLTPHQTLLIAIMVQLPLQLIVLLNLLHHVRRAGHLPQDFLQLNAKDCVPSFCKALYLIMPITFMVIIFSMIWQMFLVRCGYTPEPQALIEIIPTLGFSPELVAIFLIAVVFAPIYEEIIFRRLLMPFLSMSLGLNGAIVVSSLAFGLIHFNLAAAVPLTLLGMAFCWLYLKTRSLWTAIFLHGLFNLATITLSLAEINLQPGT